MSYRSCIVFCGNLPGDVRSSEVEDLFYKFGRIRNVDLKTPSRPPFFCFIEYEDPRDARDAVEARDGYEFGGQRLRVEISRGAGGPGGPPRGEYGGGGGDRGGGGGGGGSRYPRERGGREPPPVPRTFEGRGTGFRAVIKGLPMSASWQDLKDHFRKVVKPTFTNVYRDRGGLVGVVEFDNQEDLDLAIRKLDDTEFRNPFDSAYIRIRDESDAGKRDRSRSRGKSYSRSRSRTPYSRSRSPRSKSCSPRSPRSRSPSRGRSKSRSLTPARSASPAPRD